MYKFYLAGIAFIIIILGCMYGCFSFKQYNFELEGMKTSDKTVIVKKLMFEGHEYNEFVYYKAEPYSGKNISVEHSKSCKKCLEK